MNYIELPKPWTIKNKSITKRQADIFLVSVSSIFFFVVICMFADQVIWG